MAVQLNYAFVGHNDGEHIFVDHKLTLERFGFSKSDLMLYAPLNLSCDPFDGRAERIEASVNGIAHVDTASSVQKILGDLPNLSCVHFVVKVYKYGPGSTIIPAKRKASNRDEGNTASDAGEDTSIAGAGIPNANPLDVKNDSLEITVRPFHPPLLSGAPPPGFDWERISASNVSNLSAFETGIQSRDQFFGVGRCIIYGTDSPLNNCHIIHKSEQLTWQFLKDCGWVPASAKAMVLHEPRNGILMCYNHHAQFDNYQFFIRYTPEVEKFIFINYSDKVQGDLKKYHRKAVALDIKHHYSPYAALFLIHEMRVRGFNPFQAPIIELGIDPSWQDWISDFDVFDSSKGVFKRDRKQRGPDFPGSPMPPASSTAAAPSRTIFIGPPDEDVIDSVLTSMHEMPTWKAGVLEGMSWDGTAEENVRKYVAYAGSDGARRRSDMK